MIKTPLHFAGFLLLVTPQGVSADEQFLLRDGETIVFYGDSITQAGTYVEYIEAFLLTRFPDKHFRVVNRGISSETISGTSEPDHDPRRPWALDRFTRDIASEKPDVIVSCFGMNDGNYHPFDDQRFERFKAGIRTLIDRTRTETGARLVILTPPPYDPYSRLVLDPQARTYGYKFAAIDYDDTLAQYSRWLITLKEKNVFVVDLHSAMTEHLQKRRSAQVSFSFQRDGIHPDETGHWLIAQTLLLAWKVPLGETEVQIDSARDKVIAGRATNLRREGQNMSFSWQCPLPMPMDPKWDAESIRIENVRGRLNRCQLTVTALAPGRYRLTADGVPFAHVDQTQLDRGLDLTNNAEFPPNRDAAQILKLVQDREKRLQAIWRRGVGKWSANKELLSTTPIAELKRQAEDLRLQLDMARKPRTIEMRIERSE